MFSRLSRIDLPGRVKAPRPLTQVGVAAGLLLLVVLVRVAIDAVAPGVVPFALLFPAVMVATLTAGWVSGVAVMTLGGVFSWLTVMIPQGSDGQRTPAEAISLVLYFAAAGAIVAFAEAHRVNTRALVDEQARLRLALEAGRMAVWSVDGVRGPNPSPEFNRMMGLPEGERPSVETISELYLPGERDRIRQAANAALERGEHFFEVEYRMRRRDGALRWLLARAELEQIEDGAIREATGVIMDITERKESEERLKLLAREVDHRANNLMAVVQSTVRLSQAPTMEALKSVLIGRVAALARAHQLLSEARWEGADLRRLVAEELAAYSLGEAARVSISGPDVALAPAAAQGLAMALHELATNAAKYGGLSTPSGRVAVSWTREADGPLALCWTESGGPPVTAPIRRGLGTTMLSRALAGALGGVCKLDWRPEGLVCELGLSNEALGKRVSST